jgi:tetrapyrrole methylase family protein/MazG family protein/ATP diphosphatase
MSDAENRPDQGPDQGLAQGLAQGLDGTPGPGHRLPELVEIMRRLLAPDGCPWDREQTLDSLKPFLIEETHEVLEAIEQGSPAEHCEELGDLLMQIVFQAALRQGEGAFDIDDVIAGITDKLVRRHPHVFAGASADTSDQVLAQWQEIKAQEKRDAGRAPERLLAGVPRSLPALSRAQALADRAARVGFDAPGAGPYWDKLREEAGELEQAASQGDQAGVEDEVGDLLFTIVNLARKLGCDAETALRRANQRFSERFALIEDRLRERGATPKDASLEELDALWEQAKRDGDSTA